MRPLLLLLAALTVVACEAAPMLPPVRVALAGSRDGVLAWSQTQRAAIAPYLERRLDRTGADFSFVEDPAAADVVVRATDMTADACGLYDRGDTEVRVNAQCAAGETGLLRAIGHELLHWLTDHRYGWLGHLCTWPVNVAPPPGCHPTLVCPGEDCLLGRGLRAGDDPGPSFSEAYVPS